MLRNGASITLLLFIAGCVALPPIDSEETEEIEEFESLTSAGVVEALEIKLKKSVADNLDLFAPTHYATADQALADARALIKKDVPREQVIQKVQTANAMLHSGDRVMQNVKNLLADQLAIKKKLDSLDADKAYQNEYGSLTQRLNKVILEIEKGNVYASEDTRTTLLQDMRALEQRSLRYNAMNEPSEILKRIKYRSGETLAPITYQETIQLFQRAEEFIQNNPNNREGIERIGKEALFAAKRALYITDQVSALIQKMNFSLEQVILDEEYRLYRISRQFGNIDLRDNSLEKQSEQLAIQAKEQAEEYQRKEALITSLRDTLIEVRDSSTQRAELASAHTELSKTQKELLTQKAVFDTELATLKENLIASQFQLDNTQQTLLMLKQENTQLRQKTSTPVITEETNKGTEILISKSRPDNHQPVVIEEETVTALNSVLKLIEKQETDPEISSPLPQPNIVENDDVTLSDDFFVDADDE